MTHRAMSLYSIEFSRNPQRRCPCIIIADISDSTMGDPIAELNAGLQAYKRSLSDNDLAASRVEVALVTFGDEPHVHQHQLQVGKQMVSRAFATMDHFSPPVLETSGLTAMDKANAYLQSARFSLVDAHHAPDRKPDHLCYRCCAAVLLGGCHQGTPAYSLSRDHTDIPQKSLLQD